MCLEHSGKLAAAARSPGKVCFTGGATALLLGFREQTIDIDLKLDPDRTRTAALPGCGFAAVPDEGRGFLEPMHSMSRKPHDRSLPGEELVETGLTDLAQGRVSDYALLVQIAAPRLRRLGLHVPDRPAPEPYEHQLYARLEARLGTASHSHYNSLIRRIVSYASSLEREKSHG